MAFSVQMPALGESVTEGTVTRWLKQEGDRVEVDEPLLEVSTDKVDTEIPSPAAGVLQRIVAGEDETVEVGGELAVIGDGDSEGGSAGGSDTADDQAEPASDDAGDQGGDTPAGDAVTAPAEEEPQGSAPQHQNKAAEPAGSGQSGSGQAGSGQAGSGGSGSGGSGSGSSGGGSGTSITMPELGESVTEGTVTRWLKQVGEEVAVDEPLLEVSTDKVDTEIPSPIAGTLLEITAGEDETVEVGGQLAVIGDASGATQQDEPAPAPAQTHPPAAERDAQAPAGQEPVAENSNGKVEQPSPGAVAEAAERSERESNVGEQPERPTSDGGTTGGSGGGGGGGDGRTEAPYVTPLVRKLAAENGVDLSSISGSGVGGRIRKQDVIAAAEAAQQAEKEKQAAEQPAPQEPAAATAPSAPSAPKAPAAVAKPAAGSPEPGTTVKLPRLRQVIAQRMSESLRISAQLTTVQEVDVTRIAKLRARAKADFERREGVKLTYLPFFAKATVEALKAFPQVNASINEESKEVTYHGNVHLAIAVDTPRGLLVPVIKNAEDLNIAGLARRIADVAARTRDNKIGPDELSGGTFTITNIGSAGALFDTPIINQPQVAILGTGIITKQPMVVTGTDGEDVIAIRSVCYLPLTYDHRLVDGADAGRFVSAIKARLEGGAFETDLGL